MSDMSQGPGWWVASDGKWYPPHLHPDRIAPPPQPTSPVRSEHVTAPGAMPPTGSSDATPSDAAPPGERDRGAAVPGSRWLRRSASDRPEAEATSPDDLSAPPDDTWSRPSFPGGPFVPDAEPAAAPWAPAPAARSKTPWVVGALAVVGLAVAALIVALTSGSVSSPLQAGAETATIHITDPRSGHVSFSGSVGPMALTGTEYNGSSVSSGAVPGAPPSQDVLFNYKGDLGGTPYVLHVSLDFVSGQPQLQDGSLSLVVTGTYGSEIVTGHAALILPSSPTATSQTVTFNGNVGSQVIGGEANATRNGDGTIVVTARLSALPVAAG